jgi:hypothetical protein
MKGLKSFFSDFNEEWTFRYWAMWTLVVAVILMLMGILTLVMHGSYIQFYNGSTLTSPSLIRGWVTTLLGLAFLVVSAFGTKGPKKKSQKAKGCDKR